MTIEVEEPVLVDKLTQKEIESVELSDEHRRYKYFLNEVISSGYVYLPKDVEGWISFNFEEGNIIQVWSHPDYGSRLYQSNGWLPLPEFCKLPLNDFMNNFFIDEQKNYVAVMPVQMAKDSVIQTSEAIIKDISLLLRNILSNQSEIDIKSHDAFEVLMPVVKKNMKSKPKGSLPH